MDVAKDASGLYGEVTMKSASRQNRIVSGFAPALLLAAASLAMAGTSHATDWSLISSTDCSAAGSGFTNSVSCNPPGSATSPTVTATAWSDTYNSANVQLESATLAGFGAGWSGLGVQGRDSGDTTDPQHAMDNSSRRDSILLSFSTDISLTQVVNGWVSGYDSDMSVFAYIGDDGANNKLPTAWGASSASNPQYSQLTSQGWKLIGHYGDQDTYNISAQTSGIYSSYWLIGAYIDTVAGTCVTGSCERSTSDYIKLASVSGSTRPTTSVPEPGSLALVGLGALLLTRIRSRKSV